MVLSLTVWKNNEALSKVLCSKGLLFSYYESCKGLAEFRAVYWFFSMSFFISLSSIS